MDFINKLNADIKEAMKAKENEKLMALRAIKSEILLLQTSGKNEISDNDIIDMLQKMVKQRKQSAEIYQKEGRTDLYEKEMKEVGFIMQYLPEQMSDEELEKAISEIIKEVSAMSIKDMGKVMGIATQRFKGKAESKKIAEITKKLLNQ